MKRYKKVPFKKVAEVYEKKGANLSATSAALGVDRRTIVAWRKEYPELDEMMCDVDESLIDFSESKLMEQVSEGNITAIIFHLKTKGKNRGYVEKVEQDVNVNPFEQLMKELPDPEEEEI